MKPGRLTTGWMSSPSTFAANDRSLSRRSSCCMERIRCPCRAFNNKSNDLASIRSCCVCGMGNSWVKRRKKAGPARVFPQQVMLRGFWQCGKYWMLLRISMIMRRTPLIRAAIKQQLKATLTEMWMPSCGSGTFKPQEALPYEYKPCGC